MNAAQAVQSESSSASDTESGLRLDTELALGEVLYSGRSAAAIVRFAILPLDALSDLPIYQGLARVQRRAQCYLRLALRRRALRPTAEPELNASILALADELRARGHVALGQVAADTAGGQTQTLLERAIHLERRLGAARSAPAARVFVQLLDRELDGLEGLYPPTPLQRIDVAAAYRLARDFFVTAQLPVAERRARAVVHRSRLPLADLVQIGAEGVLHATDRFDPSFGVPFAAYAHRCVTQRISRAETRAEVIPLPLRVFKARSDLRRAIATAMVEGVASEVPVLATHLGLPERVVRAVLQSDVPVVSLDGVTGRILDETWVGEGGERVDEQAEHRDRAAVVRRALDTCPARERAVLSQLFGIGCPQRSVDQIAKELGLSAARVYQIRDVEIRRLRRPAVAKTLVAYA